MRLFLWKEIQFNIPKISRFFILIPPYIELTGKKIKTKKSVFCAEFETISEKNTT